MGLKRVSGIVLGQPKAKVVAATIPPTKEEELSKQLKYQQHWIDTLVGQVKNLVSAMKATRVSSRGAMTGGSRRQPQNTWRGGSRGEPCLNRLTLKSLPSRWWPETPRQIRGLVLMSSVGSVVKWDITNMNAPL